MTNKNDCCAKCISEEWGCYNSKCECHSPTQSEGWGTEWAVKLRADFFDDRWCLKEVNGNWYINVEALTGYLGSLLQEEYERGRQSQRDELRAEIEGMKKGWKHRECEAGRCEPCDACLTRLVHDQVLSDVLALLDKKEV